MCSLQERVQPGQEPSDLPIRLAHVLAEPQRRQGDERQDREGDERQAPVHQEHRRHDADEDEDVAEDGDQSRREQIVEGVDVGRDPRHQPADRIAVVEAEVEPLEVAVDLHPQRVHDALPDRLQDVGLAVLEGEAGDERARAKSEDQAAEAVEVAGRDVAIDGLLRQPGLGELDDRRAQHDHRRQPRPAATCGRRYTSSRRIRRAS